MPHEPFQDRVRRRNDARIQKGEDVLYWMQQSQRAEDNHALEYAVALANEHKKPVRVVFGLTADYPEANLRHYRFMLEGLADARAALEKRGIPMSIHLGHPPEVALKAAQKALALVCDRGYLRHQREWRRQAAEHSPCPVFEVESDVVVPVQTVSDKAEYAARTIRPKIHRHLERYLKPAPVQKLGTDSSGRAAGGIDLSDIDRVLSKLKLDRSVAPVSGFFKGGGSQAKRRFSGFVKNRLDRYAKNSNQPQTDDISAMSPYLHFGQISPLFLALEAKRRKGADREALESFLEELIVRRELAVNFAFFNDRYDRYDGLPTWAKKTLAEHRGDKRKHRYDRKTLEAAKTHDPYWNAAMNEMKATGFMHNYMRMYWGKKILQWSPSPEQGFETTLAINNRFFLDGRDPNSYTGVAWIYGLHDRAWAEREIFGKVRYMAASGLERKCDIQAYVEKVEDRLREAEKAAERSPQ
ncbi:MAG: deoxyribodipyrimidine photo-lyase [Desulfobacterales bacterium]|jgi:deoxyribodipyrimidine photo-lyase